MTCYQLNEEQISQTRFIPTGGTVPIKFSSNPNTNPALNMGWTVSGSTTSWVITHQSGESVTVAITDGQGGTLVWWVFSADMIIVHRSSGAINAIPYKYSFRENYIIRFDDSSLYIRKFHRTKKYINFNNSGLYYFATNISGTIIFHYTHSWILDAQTNTWKWLTYVSGPG
jgi:hypothetical protein